MLFSVVLMFILGLFYTAATSRLTQVNMAYIIPGVLAVCIAGAYAYRGFSFDTYLFLVIGFLALIMVANKFDFVPLVLGRCAGAHGGE
jgi:TctA family transporter